MPVFLLASCDPGQQMLAWEIDFADDGLRGRAAFVEGSILEGGCEGAAIYTDEVARGGGAPDLPPALEPGVYGFSGRARDASCAWFAAACVELEVPSDLSTITVVLEAVPEEAECAPSACTEGVCGAIDAGMDAGPDAGPFDAGECTTDAECGTCMRCEMGGCVADDGASCAGGVCQSGACCTGCLNGTACEPGTEPSACGTGGGACAVCSAPAPFCDAACVGPRPVESFAVGSEFACAIATDTSLWCWGSNVAGQLGQSTAGPGTESDTPVLISTGWVAVGAGDEHVCAIRDDDSIWCWGDNEDGQLLTGDTTSRATPTRFDTTEVFVSADGGLNSDHTCLMRGDGALFCAGQNDYGQCGVGTFVDVRMLAQVTGTWIAVGLGHHNTCGAQMDGSLHCWGENLHGQLGNGMSGTMMSVSTPQRVGALTGWTAVAHGDHHVCAVRAGELHCWGFNGDGQVGNGMTTDVLMPLRIGTATDWSETAAGLEHSCGLRTDGTLYCWGRNDVGQVGIGGVSTSDQRMPVQVAESDWQRVEAGSLFTCGLRAGGRLFCWGSNTLGQLAQGDRTNRTAPVEVLIPRP